MRVVHDIASLRSALAELGPRALVPTMGNLHAGHMSLIGRARASGLPVVASVFVNRLQFGPNEDFDRYPRTLEADARLLEEHGCALLFAPTEDAMYPRPQTFRVQPDPALAGILDGAARPGHFEGVATVVMKLLQLVGPDVAVFGRKDYQQLLLIRRMVEQFGMPVDIIGVDTARADDGLALSSRNAYLDPAQRAEAPRLAAALAELARATRAARSAAELPALERAAADTLACAGWAPDYLTVRRRDDLLAPGDADLGGPLVALAAARLGTTRLIDNLEF